MSRRTLNLSDDLYQYILNVGVRESELLRQLREETALDSMSRMQISPEQGQFLSLLVQISGARKALEIGTFTGYSSICIAQALAPQGVLTCCDVDEKWTRIAQRYWQKAEIENKITLKLQPAINTLKDLLKCGEGYSFDFIFIDADKESYMDYYELSLRLLKPAGLIVVDNVLWNGAVIDPTKNDVDTKAIRNFNTQLKNDNRVDISLVPISDGLTIIRKK